MKELSNTPRLVLGRVGFGHRSHGTARKKRNENQWKPTKQKNGGIKQCKTRSCTHTERKVFDTNWLYRHWIRLIEYSGARFLFFPRFAAAFFSADLKSSQRRNKKSSGRLYCVIVTLLFQSCKRSLLSLSAKICFHPRCLAVGCLAGKRVWWEASADRPNVFHLAALSSLVLTVNAF